MKKNREQLKEERKLWKNLEKGKMGKDVFKKEENNERETLIWKLKEVRKGVKKREGERRKK